MEIDKNQLKQELSALKKENFDIVSEAEHIVTLVNDPKVKKMLNGYEYVNVIAAGGSGIVFTVKEPKSDILRAMKLSRCTAAKPLNIDPDNPVKVDLEMAAMAMVSHGNITHLYNAVSTESEHYCFITQLVHEQKTFDEYIEILIGRNQNFKTMLAIENVLKTLTEKLIFIADALCYMHNELELYHMDIKPGNLLVDNYERPYVTDLGFARCKKKYSSEERIPVGFTYGFAHPRLSNPNKGKFRILSTLAKARNILFCGELNPKFDLYSFGRTILFLLKSLKKHYGEHIKSSYSFSYLHLLSTLLLDNENVESQEDDSEDDEFLCEYSLGFTKNLVSENCIKSFAIVKERLERLLDRWPIKTLVPEIDPWYIKSVNHGCGYLNMTPRISSIIDHPFFQRLRRVKHLGIIDHVFPGSTHTRFAHSLGVCDNICRYIDALYNDQENPIFRVIINSKDIASVIIAGLIHDIAQTEFAHELEELNENIFSHKKFFQQIIENEKITDSKNRSLRKIIEGDEYDEWGLDYHKIIQILKKDDSAPGLTVIFNEMLDSVIDADKLDYLNRDARNCNLTYSIGIDIDRFLRCMTTIPFRVGNRYIIRLGIKEKGLAAAESITEARHKMYQANYLQHTSRCVKSMILSACNDGLHNIINAAPDDLNPDLFKRNILSELYLQFILRFENFDISNHTLKNPKAINGIWKKIKNGYNTFLNSFPGFDLSIGFFFGYMSPRAVQLLIDSLQRPPYKRLVEISFSDINEEQRQAIRKALSWSSRERTLKDIEEELLTTVEKKIQNRIKIRESLRVPDDIRKLSCNKVLITADIPLRSLGPGGSPPPVFKDISRKAGKYEHDEGSKIGWGHIWKEGMEKMMLEITTCRIFCEPEFHSIVKAMINQSELHRIISRIIPDWPSQ